MFFGWLPLPVDDDGIYTDLYRPDGSHAPHWSRYFSNIDWYDPDMRIDQWNAVASEGAGDCTACGPVVVVTFDDVVVVMLVMMACR